MRLVFMGTPEFAVPTLQLLHSRHRILAVFTQPDRPRGRGQKSDAPPVKKAAGGLGLAVHQPERIHTPEVLELLRSLDPEAVVIAAYGKLIPQSILDLPAHGCLNLHASLLPRYRGAAPVNWALVRGETRTGVTTLRIDAGLDTGDILLQQEVPIAPEDEAITLLGKLSLVGAPLLAETLRRLEQGDLTPTPQDHSQATLAPRLSKEDGRIEWNWPARHIANRVRGLVPWPGAYTHFRGTLLHIWKAKEIAEAQSAEPGALVTRGNRLFAACGSGALELLEVQPEARRRMSVADFINGARLQPGEKLE